MTATGARDYEAEARELRALLSALGVQVLGPCAAALPGPATAARVADLRAALRAAERNADREAGR